MLTNAVVYDIETFPNVILVTIELLHSESRGTWELSEFRDDRETLMQTLYTFANLQVPMIGFSSLSFDYPVLHYLYYNQDASVHQIYGKARSIIHSNDRFGHMVWDDQRFCPQIDLFKIHHFDNNAKGTSLKALEINMRSPNVVNSPCEFDTCLTREQIANDLRPYSVNDVVETKRFAHYSLPAINFRIGLCGKLGRHDLEVLNYNDTKIGEKMLEQRIGRHICYSDDGQRMQTPRKQIALADIIFPYIRFQTPEFNRVLDFMRAQVLQSEQIDFEDVIQTKGVFKNLTANVGGLEFVFGTGGVHASVERQRFAADDETILVDIDVVGLYPDIAVKNKLAPEHLGQRFITEYAKIPEERKTYAKGTYENAALKLAANGAWGKSNSKWSVFYDPKYAMTIPINGQLMICMLAEALVAIPTLQLIQANTDGITYRIARVYEPYAAEVCKWWEAFTCLTLERAEYKRMWIRDVNNYVAEGKTLKQKGAYWHPDPNNYADSISQASPPCWYKDLGNVVSIRAAVAAMVHSVDVDAYVRAHRDPFDFMLRAKAGRGAKLLLGEHTVQPVTRYYIAREGLPLFKLMPPAGPIGTFKRGQGVSEADYDRVMAANGGTWDASVCTKNQSRYANSMTGIEVGWLVADCNNADAFRFENVNYDYYIAEARKLIV